MAYNYVGAKSPYCFEELNKSPRCYTIPKYEKKDCILTSKNPPNAKDSVGDDDERNRHSFDVAFLRKLLALNKKQEMMLNKKLAQLLVAEEFGKQTEDLRKGKRRLAENSQLSKKTFMNEEQQVSKLITDQEIAEKYSRRPLTIVSRRHQYDLNGRRIYNESEAEDEEPNSNSCLTIGRKGTYIHTTEKPFESYDLAWGPRGNNKATRKHIMLKVDQPTSEIAKNEDNMHQKEEDHFENKYKKSIYTKMINSPELMVVEEDKDAIHGDSMRQTAVRCREVVKDKTESEIKTNIKVWNFKNIQKLKRSPATTEESLYNRSHKNVPISDKKWEDDSKIGRNTHNTNQKQSVRRDARSKTVC